MWTGVFVVMLLASSAAFAQDLEIYSLHVRSDVQLRFATTLVTSRVANLANASNEAKFTVVLPDAAFISNFTMEIDGVIYPGKVEEKNEARKKYQKAKKKGKSTGLVSNNPRDSKKFSVQVNVAAFSKVTFNLTYQELLKRTLGVYQHKIFINPGQPVNDLQINVAIQESRDITTLHVPPIQTGNSLHSNEFRARSNPLAVITQPSSRTALITYAPTKAQQLAQSNLGLSGQFIVEYDVERSLDAGELLMANGYFVHFVAPALDKPLMNDVVFVLDVSGSMDGDKIDQLRTAMLKILDELKVGDRFNIILFSDSTSLYSDEMIAVNEDSISSAKQYIRRLRSSGSTNLNKGLLDGIEMLNSNKTDHGRPLLLVFLTDGHPMTGTTSTIEILNNVMEANQGKVSMFGLAFGENADKTLVRKIAAQNDGFSRQIYQDSDAALQISGFYDEMAVALINNVTIKYIGDTVDQDSLTKSNFKNFFNGSEIVVAGKVDPNTRSVDVRLLGDDADGSLVLSGDMGTTFDDVKSLMEISDIEEITEKLWAYLTIKQLLEDTERDFHETAIDAKKHRALDLSLQYGFVTPLTSMVVTRPEDEDDEDTISKTTTTQAPTARPASSRRGGGGGGGGGGYGGGGGGDPHYLIRIRGIEHPLCFDVKGRAGEVHNLLTDPAHGITVNTMIIQSKLIGRDGEPKTFIGQVSVQLPNHVIVITPDAVFYDTKVWGWVEDFTKHFGGSQLVFVNGRKTLSIRLNFGPEILIRRSSHHEPDTGKVDFLSVFVKDEDQFSKRTTGLIGQFVNGHKHIWMKNEHTQPGGKIVAKFQVKERVSNSAEIPDPQPARHVVRGNLINRSEVVDNGTELCWMIHKENAALLLGKPEQYVTDAFIKQTV